MSNDIRTKFEQDNEAIIKNLIRGQYSYLNQDGSYRGLACIATDSWIGYRQGYEQAVKDMEPKWISVEDELPKIGEEVLTTFEGCEEVELDYLEIDPDNYSEYWANHAEDLPTHWMRIYKKVPKP